MSRSSTAALTLVAQVPDAPSGAELWVRLQRIHADPAAVRAWVQAVMERVQSLQRRMVEVALAAFGAG